MSFSHPSQVSATTGRPQGWAPGPRRFCHAITASRASPTLWVLVRTTGPSRKPDSESQARPVISPLPLRAKLPANTGSFEALPRGWIAVTPVRTGPRPTSSLPSPETSVTWPTSTPATSVIAFSGPGVPSNGTPRSRARGFCAGEAAAAARPSTSASRGRVVCASLLLLSIGPGRGRGILADAPRPGSTSRPTRWRMHANRRRTDMNPRFPGWLLSGRDPGGGRGGDEPRAGLSLRGRELALPGGEGRGLGAAVRRHRHEGVARVQRAGHEVVDHRGLRLEDAGHRGQLRQRQARRPRDRPRVHELRGQHRLEDHQGRQQRPPVRGGRGQEVRRPVEDGPGVPVHRRRGLPPEARGVAEGRAPTTPCTSPTTRSS